MASEGCNLYFSFWAIFGKRDRQMDRKSDI